MAAPKKRGRAAAYEQLSEKGAAGGAGVLSPPIGGGLPASSSAGFGIPSGPPLGGKAALAAAAPAERRTFAENVADVKDGVEKARAEYRSRAAGALGAAPSSGPSPVTSHMHQRFQNLEAAWGEVMDSVNIDPFSTATPGVNAASAALSRNRRGLDEQVDAVIADLWDGVSSGAARTMTDSRRDDMMQKVLSAPGGMQLSPKRPPPALPGAGPQTPARGAHDARGGYESFKDFQLAQPSPAWGGHNLDQLQLVPQSPGYGAPPAGAQDFETRRQLEIMREDILRLENAVLSAVEAEEAELPPPPPLIEKHPAGIQALSRAAAYEDIVHRIHRSEVGCEPDSGGTPCNSVDDPNIPLIMPPRGGLKIRQQIEALQKETQDLKEATVQEIGGEAAMRRMKEMQNSMKAARAKRI